MITHNRPYYLEHSLKNLLKCTNDEIKVTIWDNASNEETKRVIEKYKEHKGIDKVIYWQQNEKLRFPTNWFWENNSSADYLGKVDDDCIVDENWCDILLNAHKDIQNAGILGCWHFFEDDFDYEKAKDKIQTIGKHRIFKNCWVGGSGYLIKSRIIREMGLLKKNESFTDYCIRATAKGYINGWYYPFIFQDHMDDPRSSYTIFKTDNDFINFRPLTAVNFNIETREEWINHLKSDAEKLHYYSLNPYDYMGLIATTKKKLYRFMKKEYFPMNK